MNNLRILLIGLPLLPVWITTSAQAESTFLVYTKTLSGQPRIVLPHGEKIFLQGKRLIRPGERVVTSEGSRVLIHFLRRPGCRLVLEPNSSFQLMDMKPGNTYFTKLHRGVVKCEKSTCGLNLSVATPTGMLRGKGAEFALQAYRHSTTVILKRGQMRLLVGGQAIALREMTRTTVSRTGGHRIATMYSGDFRIYRPRDAFPSPPPKSRSFSTNRRLPKNRISPVSTPTTRSP